MGMSKVDRTLIAWVADGLSLAPRPYADIGAQLGIAESEVIDRLRGLLADGTLKRMGVVVRHRTLGYKANAMIVWNVPDADSARIGAAMSSFPFVTLCYRRPRRMPHWPYNLFCMIHGRDRPTVERQVTEIVESLDLSGIDHSILFSRRCFKQRGARYESGGEES